MGSGTIKREKLHLMINVIVHLKIYKLHLHVRNKKLVLCFYWVNKKHDSKLLNTTIFRKESQENTRPDWFKIVFV